MNSQSRMASRRADSQKDQDTEEPQHRLGHVMKFVAETLDGIERGRVTLPEEGKGLFNQVRDVLVRLL